MFDLSVPVHHFTKLAKALVSSVRAGDVAAFARVRTVFVDASPSSNDALIAAFGLMRAQHVVAVEHGFTNWKTLTDASGVEARLAITMARHSELNDFGIGLYGGHKDKPEHETTVINLTNRQTLRSSGKAVEATVAWLRENIEPTRTINQRRSSYGIKHVADKDIGYITNGVLIAAGIIAGYPYKIVPGSPNVSFGMSERSLRDVSTRRRSPEHVLKKYTPYAAEILAKRGVQAFASIRSGVQLVWRDEGDARTLRIDAYQATPFIVRLYVDEFPVLVSAQVARALGAIASVGRYIEVRPARPGREISVLLDEVAPALDWVLSEDARSTSQPAAPFAVTNASNRSYVWSKRAAQRFADREKAASPQL